MNFKKLQAGEITSYSMEKRYIRPDNSVVWVSMTVARLTIADNDCLNQDIV
ncbi:MAG: hypothetical protein GX936_00060 [Clostridiales bacterium]|jgi:hypothetical protein|nr:hypothetical protein [Clostridiales bacterium]